ncbi:MAG: AI-2E family transporter [Phycisphaeraceae bacterium]|nr:MAG: AI-2E family transporter [Phycisphaeraceae bacterium]
MSKRGEKPSTASDKPVTPEGTPFHRLHIWQIQACRDVLFVAAVVGVFWLGYVLSAVTVPLLVALLLAYLFEPLIGWMCRRPRLAHSRLHAVITLMLTAGAVVMLIASLVLPIVVGQSIRFVNEVRDGTAHARLARVAPYIPEGIRVEFESILNMLPERPAAAVPRDEASDESRAGAAEPGEEGAADADAPISDEPPLTREEARRIAAEEAHRALADRARRESSAAGGMMGTGWSAITTLFGRAAQVLLLLFLIPFYFFFFSVGYPSIMRFGHTLIPVRHRHRVVTLVGKMDRVVAGFVRGRITICAICGVLLAIGWWAAGVPYGFVLGLAVGVMFLVPYLSGIGLPLAILLLFFERLGDADRAGAWWVWVILWPSAVYGFVQLVETYILTPKIAGKATNLDPVTVIVAVLAGGSLLGVYGMLLAIPLAACGKIMLTDVVMPAVNAWLKGERPDPLPIDPGGGTS